MPASKKFQPKPSATHSGPQAARPGTTNRPPAANGHAHAVLVRELADRFGQDSDSPELPLVVINRVPQTRTVHAVVIWDRWKDLTVPQRGRVIADAYATARPDERDPVTLPMGLTPGEALRQGFLPYQIVPMARAGDGVTAEQVTGAMQAAGGVLLRVGDDVQLRFATRGQANAAYRRLVERINKPIWAISEEVARSDWGD